MHGAILLLPTRLHGMHSDNFPSTSNPLLNKANPVSLTRRMLLLTKSTTNDKRQHHTIITRIAGSVFKPRALHVVNEVEVSMLAWSISVFPCQQSL